VANSICPYLMQSVYTNPATKMVDFKGLFLVPLIASAGAAVALALFFHPPKAPAASAGGSSAPAH
jgi:hypothetical protein